jgi:hypothetical protein
MSDHSLSPDSSLLTQVEALIADWREYADQLSAANTTTSLSFAAGVRKCADQLQPLLVLLVEQQRKDLESRMDRQTVIPPERATAPTNELASALKEVARLRLATSEGSLGVRADRMWQIAEDALSGLSPSAGEAPAGDAVRLSPESEIREPTDPQQDEKDPFIAFCEPCITTRWCAWKGGCLAERIPPASTDLQQLRARYSAVVSALQQYGQHARHCDIGSCAHCDSHTMHAEQ